MSGATAARATHERQVRSMFDRIAGRYDAMNSVMSAGLHHRWRARTVGHGRGRPRGVGARRLLRHRRPRARAAAAGRARGARGGARLLRADAGAGGAQVGRDGRGGRMGPGQRARAAVRGLRPSTRRRSASGCATSPTFARAIAEMARVVRPGGRVAILEITTPQRPPLKWFYSIWFDRIVPLLGTAGRRPRGLHLPAQLGAPLPARARARGADALGRAARRAVRRPGRRHRRDPFRRACRPADRAMSAVDDVVLLGGGRGCPALMERSRAPSRGDRRRPRRGAGRRGGGNAGRRRQAPAAAARLPVCGRERGRGARARRRRGRAGPHGDAGPRRRRRPCRPAARPRHRVRDPRPADRDRDRRLRVLARVLAACRERRRATRSAVLADACLALAVGELAQRHDAYRDDISEERYVLRCRLKTASLFAAACRLGALAAGAPGGGSRRRSRRSARTSASHSRCSTTCWT